MCQGALEFLYLVCSVVVGVSTAWDFLMMMMISFRVK